MNSIHTDSLRAALLGGRQQKFPKGQVLYFSDDRMTLGILESGYVKRYSITSEGNQSIQSIYGPGDIFPLTPVFRLLFNMELSTGSEVLYYEPITAMTMYSISATELQNLLQEQPNLHKDLLFVCGERLKSNIQRLENISLKTALSQVAHQLLYFAERFGTTEDGVTTINVPLTHQTLASILNLARETVSLNIQRLQDKQVITTSPKLAVTSLDGLRREAS